MSEERVASLAAEAKAAGKLGNSMLSAGAVVAQSPAMSRLMKLAADAEAAGIRADRTGKLTFNGMDLTPYIQVVTAPEKLPHNPANRRTFHLANKPYHYVQLGDRLETRPGESPWI